MHFVGTLPSDSRGSIWDTCWLRQRYMDAAWRFLAALKSDSAAVKSDSSLADAAFSQAISALQQAETQQKTAFGVLAGANFCNSGASIPQELASQILVEELVTARCHGSRVASTPGGLTSRTCKADSGQASLGVSTVMFYTLGAVDQVGNNGKLALSILVLCGGVALFGWRRLRLPFMLRGRGTAPDKGESRAREPEG